MESATIARIISAWMSGEGDQRSSWLYCLGIAAGSRVTQLSCSVLPVGTFVFQALPTLISSCDVWGVWSWGCSLDKGSRCHGLSKYIESTYSTCWSHQLYLPHPFTSFHILSHPFTSFHIFYLTGSLGSCIFSSILVSPPCWASRSLVFSSVSQAHQCGKSKLVPVGIDQTIFACPASTNSAIMPILSQHDSIWILTGEAGLCERRSDVGGGQRLADATQEWGYEVLMGL